MPEGRCEVNDFWIGFTVGAFAMLAVCGCALIVFSVVYLSSGSDDR